MGTFGFRIAGRFVKVARPFFVSEMRWRALAFIGLLLTLLLGISGLNLVNSYVGRDFMSALAERSTAGYTRLALAYVGVFAASTIVAVLERFTEERFGLSWRNWLTRHLIVRYLSNQSYQRLNSSDEVDNPDQRISEDVRAFTATTLSFSLMLLNSTITAFAFLGVLWSISPWLFVVAMIYPFLGTGVTLLIGRRLVTLNNDQLRKEADLRFGLARVREHAEILALQGPEHEREESERLLGRLSDAVRNLASIIAVNRNLGFFINFYNYLIQIIPLLVTAPLYFRGQVEFGVVTQSAMAFAHVVNAFSLIVQQFQNISSFAAVIDRLGALWEAIDAGGPLPPAPAPARPTHRAQTTAGGPASEGDQALAGISTTE